MISFKSVVVAVVRFIFFLLFSKDITKRFIKHFYKTIHIIDETVDKNKCYLLMECYAAQTIKGKELLVVLCQLLVAALPIAGGAQVPQKVWYLHPVGSGTEAYSSCSEE